MSGKEIVVILHNVRSLHNVGSIFRTADAAGVSKIYLSGITPAPVDRFGKVRPQLAKVALGAEKSVPWEWIKLSAELKLMKRLRKEGYKILAVEQSQKSIPYYKTNLTKLNFVRLVLVMGNEIRGLSPAILKKCDKILEIPMRGAVVRQTHHPRHAGRGKESLNVSVAFGIVVFSLLYP